MITGQTLIDWGFEPGPWFGEAIMIANDQTMDRKSDDEIREVIARFAESRRLPPEIPLRTNSLPIADFLASSVSNAMEQENHRAVVEHMDVLMRTPVVKRGAIMPDACPAGSQAGTIPVGGVVASEAIHPGMHSADICCSMAISVFKRKDDVAKVLDAAMLETHFGPGGRKISAWQHSGLNKLISTFESNPFLKGLEDYAITHFMTQGDGNHFLYVGESSAMGNMVIVTHHGSRGLGGQLYKRGKAAAERHTKIVAPRIPMHNAWIEPGKTEDDYFAALQTIRQWTKLNHFAIHDAIGQRLGNRIVAQWWNEHNFVFRKSDGLFYHAKGATPAYHGFAEDSSGATLIPLNMSEPILMVEPSQLWGHEAMGFAPHGAGRNMSRTAHTKILANEYGADARGLSPNNIAEIMARETKGIDVRFYTGAPDVSELPSAYKNAQQVTAAIERHNLAKITDTIQPLGTIMAGEMNWNRRR